MSQNSRERTGKVIALRDRAGTAGERAAAAAAVLDRLAVKPAGGGLKPADAPLSDGMVKKLSEPVKGSKIHYDPVLPGFGIRVTAAGARSFVLNYRTASGRERRITIGAFPNWTVGAARTEARRLKRMIDEGGDPLGDVEAEREAPTVNELADRFETEHLTRRRPGTASDYRSMLVKYIRPALGRLKVADIVFADIDRLHHRITGAGHPRRANTVVAVLSKMLSLAIRWDMRADNPCRGIERNGEVKRKRYLSGDELARLTKALTTYPEKQSADVVRVLLLTGARRGEVLGMRWADVDLTAGIWSKPGSTTKQKADHVVPLSVPAQQLLAEIRKRQTAKRQQLPEHVFPGAGESGHVVEIKRAWRTLCKHADIAGLRIHDLRHSFASQLASGGASLPLIGALLGHSSPATTARYSHLFQDPQRAAVEKVAAIVTAAENGGAGGPVVTKSGKGRGPARRG
jgi:integrase